ncbi:MAG: PHP domain-containing protein [Chloroflexota bacterium]
MNPDPFVRVEFHCHTCYSSDGVTTPEELIRVCQERGIQRVVVTDHNTITGALAAQRLDPERVIVGEEIRTTRGELLAAFVTEEIPARLSPQETIRLLRQQGAFISVSHPFDPFRSGWSLEDMLELVPLVDAIETYNSHCFWPGFNTQAQAFARQYGLPGTVGSDAHQPHELGQAILRLPAFRNADELKVAIQQSRQEIISKSIWFQLWERISRRLRKAGSS